MRSTRIGNLSMYARTKENLVPILAIFLCSCCSALSLTTSSRPSLLRQPESPTTFPLTLPLDGDWRNANLLLQDKECCVVKISKLEQHLSVLQEALMNEGPLDVDLRARIQTSQHHDVSYQDCSKVMQSVLSRSDGNSEDENSSLESCSFALHELARGMASMATGCGLLDKEENESGMDVHCRIVCASNYQARDPPFHTDKAPLRGYVTLKGLGTEFMERSCNPLEYMALRMLGVDVSKSIVEDLKNAKELEFIVMKGDFYHQHDASPSRMEQFWTRATACVHRSPPNEKGNNNRRRIIISFDLADGDDDREWFQIDKKREWRNGLTQRKSKLVA